MSDVSRVVDHNNTIITPFSVESIAVYGQATIGTAATSVGAWPTANAAIFIPFRVGQPITIVKITWQNGATASGNVDVGIYDSEGNRLVSSGSTAQTGTAALQTVDISDVTLNNGLYYMAMVMDNTTGTVRRTISIPAVWAQALGVYSQAAAFALPSTAAFAGTTLAFVPMMMLTSKVLV